MESYYSANCLLKSADYRQQPPGPAVFLFFETVGEKQVGPFHCAEWCGEDISGLDSRFQQLVSVRKVKIHKRVAFASWPKVFFAVHEVLAKGVHHVPPDLIIPPTRRRSDRANEVAGLRPVN